MPPIPASKMTELLLSRRKLFEKIVQHVAKRRVENTIQATGARMSATPQQFGMQVGKQMGKQALVFLPAAAGIGAGLGAVTSPAAHRSEGAGRGALKATGTAVGATVGAPLGMLAALMMMTRGKKMPGRFLGGSRRIGGATATRRAPPIRTGEALARLYAAIGLGGGTGGALGGTAGYAGTSAMLGKPSWENKQAGAASSVLNSIRKGLGTAAKTLASDDVFYPAAFGTLGAGGAMLASEAYRSLKTPNAKPAAVNKTLPRKPIVGGINQNGVSSFEQVTAPVMQFLSGQSSPVYRTQKQSAVMPMLGGALGSGVGGLAGATGGGLLGALAGGAMGGGHGAGLGLLGGGALGMGAGAHLGGHIGASIGKKKKDDESKKEETAEHKEDDNGEEEVKKSAAAVLALLDRKSTRLNSSHVSESRMPSSA